MSNYGFVLCPYFIPGRLRPAEGALTPFLLLFLPNLLRPILLRPEIHPHCSIPSLGRIGAVSASCRFRETTGCISGSGECIFLRIPGMLNGALLTQSPAASIMLLRENATICEFPE